jgi:uncharacterized OB-fold protein
VTQKPLPVPDASSAGYWDAAARGELALPRCSVCRKLTIPPAMVCPHCRTSNPDFTFVPVEGAGRVRSWTVVRDAFLPGFSDEVPYVLVDVELDAQRGLRMIGRLVDGPDAAVCLDARVTVTFDELDENVAVPSFSLQR